MGSRQKTGDEAVRLPEMTRRAIIAGTSVAALGGGKSAAAAVTTNETAKLCTRWLRLNAKIERLQDRWAKLESWLIREHSWCELSGAEQQALPWAKELRDIDGCLDILFQQRDDLLETLPALGAVDLDAVIAKLTVVERLIWPVDHPEAHALIAGSVQDLLALTQRGAHAWNRPWNSAS